MIKRIKQAITNHYGEQEWFLICLKTGGWNTYDSWLGFVEHRIQIDRVCIDIRELQNGYYRVSVGIPNPTYNTNAVSWSHVEFASTGKQDQDWEYRVRLLLADAYNHPVIFCD